MTGIKQLRLETLAIMAEILDILRLHIANVTFFNNSDVAARNLSRVVELSKRLEEINAKVAELDD